MFVISKNHVNFHQTSNKYPIALDDSKYIRCISYINYKKKGL